ncbi:5-methylcytosine-specific restriction enzyme A [Nitrosospira multiformis ATCC 25196]|uniref:5-methylcytosine-specific restriction enzyme A n=1 Tax=Nitrosospira multiformis (strain ATCC 25196 / NCIMB 11849 / C 71) TaxID=323848 RepID=Q2Y8M1_NITMU|nr:HNH endonuclease [Nitrosospira multiformis]ABB74900.1 HNH nuclease [Nitrosospira multiformis ATCC 25196]SEG08343.1 5-methylcytosine-specific restriction enzyme A [Nitrosospira multiformis ATCC 25196]
MDDVSWSDEELKASIEAYVEMQRNERTGQLIVKKQYYKKLVEMFGRSERVFESLMQNISYVLSLMGRGWMSGLKPARDIGPLVAARIEQLLEQISGQKAVPVAAFEIAVREAAEQKDLPKPSGNPRPKRRRISVAQLERDPNVKAWVLQQAAGTCESCEKPAPFQGADGSPYLELHYVQGLADGGADAVSNAVALCPNCHREIHYGANAQAVEAWLYDTVQRLERD